MLAGVQQLVLGKDVQTCLYTADRWPPTSGPKVWKFPLALNCPVILQYLNIPIAHPCVSHTTLPYFINVVTLPVVLYGCETWSLTLREECRLRVFKNRILRRIFEPKRDENGEWRRLQKLNLWLTAPKGATPVNQTSVTDRQMTVRRSVILHYATSSLIMVTFLIRSDTSQSSNNSIFLTRQDGPRSRPNPHLKLWKCQESNPRPHGQ